MKEIKPDIEIEKNIGEKKRKKRAKIRLKIKQIFFQIAKKIKNLFRLQKKHI